MGCVSWWQFGTHTTSCISMVTSILVRTWSKITRIEQIKICICFIEVTKCKNINRKNKNQPITESIRIHNFTKPVSIIVFDGLVIWKDGPERQTSSQKRDVFCCLKGQLNFTVSNYTVYVAQSGICERADFTIIFKLLLKTAVDSSFSFCTLLYGFLFFSTVEQIINSAKWNKGTFHWLLSSVLLIPNWWFGKFN